MALRLVLLALAVGAALTSAVTSSSKSHSDHHFDSRDQVARDASSSEDSVITPSLLSVPWNEVPKKNLQSSPPPYEPRPFIGVEIEDRDRRAVNKIESETPLPNAEAYMPSPGMAAGTHLPNEKGARARRKSVALPQDPPPNSIPPTWGNPMEPPPQRIWSKEGRPKNGIVARKFVA
ncbi:hypothetical protein VTO42DRAFT_7713 [Malbranchea cinnamomea]